MGKIVPVSVYLIAAPEVRRVKIGVSENVVSRLKTLQAQSGAMLELVDSFVTPDYIVAGRVESLLHSKLRLYHSHYEWFTDCEEVREAFEKAKINSRVTPAPRLDDSKEMDEQDWIREHHTF